MTYDRRATCRQTGCSELAGEDCDGFCPGHGAAMAAHRERARAADPYRSRAKGQKVRPAEPIRVEDS